MPTNEEFAAYAAATGTPYPRTAAERAQLAPAVMQWKAQQQAAREQQVQPERNALSNGAAIGAGLLGLGTLGYAIYQALKGPPDPPSSTAAVGPRAPTDAAVVAQAQQMEQQMRASGVPPNAQIVVETPSAGGSSSAIVQQSRVREQLPAERFGTEETYLGTRRADVSANLMMSKYGPAIDAAEMSGDTAAVEAALNVVLQDPNAGEVYKSQARRRLASLLGEEAGTENVIRVSKERIKRVGKKDAVAEAMTRAAEEQESAAVPARRITALDKNGRVLATFDYQETKEKGGRVTKGWVQVPTEAWKVRDRRGGLSEEPGTEDRSSTVSADIEGEERGFMPSRRTGTATFQRRFGHLEPARINAAGERVESPEAQLIDQRRQQAREWAIEGVPLAERLQTSLRRPVGWTNLVWDEGTEEAERIGGLLNVLEGDRKSPAVPVPFERSGWTTSFAPVVQSTERADYSGKGLRFDSTPVRVRTFGDLPAEIRENSWVRASDVLGDRELAQLEKLPAGSMALRGGGNTGNLWLRGSEIPDQAPIPAYTSLYRRPVPEIGLIYAARELARRDLKKPENVRRLQQLQAAERDYLEAREPAYVIQGGELLERVRPIAPYAKGATQGDLAKRQRSEMQDYSNQNVDQRKYDLAELGQNKAYAAAQILASARVRHPILRQSPVIFERVLKTLAGEFNVSPADIMNVGTASRVFAGRAVGRADGEDRLKPGAMQIQGDWANPRAIPGLTTPADSRYAPFEEGLERQTMAALPRQNQMKLMELRQAAVSTDPGQKAALAEHYIAQIPSLKSLIKDSFGDMEPLERVNVVSEGIAAAVDDYTKTLELASRENAPDWAKRAAASAYAAGEKGRSEFRDFMRAYLPDYVLGRLVQSQGGNPNALPRVTISQGVAAQLVAESRRSGAKENSFDALVDTLNRRIRGAETTLDAAWALTDLQRNLADVTLFQEDLYGRGMAEKESGAMGRLGQTPRTNGALLALYARQAENPKDIWEEGSTLQLRMTQLRADVGTPSGAYGAGVEAGGATNSRVPFRLVFGTELTEPGGMDSATAGELQEERLSKPVKVTGKKQPAREESFQMRTGSIDTRIKELEDRRKRSPSNLLQGIDDEIAALRNDRAYVQQHGVALNKLLSTLNRDVALAGSRGTGELMIDYGPGDKPRVMTSERVYQAPVTPKQESEDENNAPFDVAAESRIAEQGMTAEQELTDIPDVAGSRMARNRVEDIRITPQERERMQSMRTERPVAADRSIPVNQVQLAYNRRAMAEQRPTGVRDRTMAALAHKIDYLLSQEGGRPSMAGYRAPGPAMLDAIHRAQLRRGMRLDAPPSPSTRATPEQVLQPEVLQRRRRLAIP